MRLLQSTFLLSLVLLPGAFAQITLNQQPTRVIGQPSALQVSSANPNLIEGREFFAPQGIALDTSTSPPGLYVSDTGNNRVLGFRSATGFANGQKADVVIGQKDFISSFAQGPATNRSAITTGLAAPTGLAVDASGNLYVVDSTNNRVLRFPTPFRQTDQLLPDLVIGQSVFTVGTPNQNGTSPTASSLAFVVAVSATSAATLSAYIAFDPQGNLWVADAGNNRILRFPVSTLGNPATSGPSADLVLGQSDFTSRGYTPAPNANPLLSLTAIATPTGIAFDTQGRLFIAESTNSTRNGRILMWNPPFFTGQPAARVLGVNLNSPPPVSEFQTGRGPGSLFPIGNSIGIADINNNRILIFPPVEQWTPGTTFQAATTVAGQPDFTSSAVNRGQPVSSASSLSQPAAALSFANELYVLDSQNHRLVVLPQNGNSFDSATRILGQDAPNRNTVNLVEGREFDFTSLATGSTDAGITVDLNSTPPHLYVADTYNHRILGFNDLRNIPAGAKADLVIGQPDLASTLINYPGNNANVTNASGLFAPTGILVDPAGNLYVADTGNGRVLRFPKPFEKYVPGQLEQADLVLGQLSFTSPKIVDPTARTMSAPYGLGFTNNPGLLVSDLNHNRVLYFKGKSDDLRSGMSAATVFGQQDFNSLGSGSGLGELSNPRHISVDLEDRLYVADTGNSRVLIWDTIPGLPSGAPAAVALTSGLTSPRSVYVSPATNDIWVGDAGSGAVPGVAIRYSPYNQLKLNGFVPNAALLDAFSPRALTQDAWGNLFIADAANRVIVHYPALGAVNAATYLFRNNLAPGMITSLFSLGNKDQFGGQAASAPAGVFPLPNQLNGIQVTFNGAPVRLFYADKNQINFQVPVTAPSSGTASLQVLDLATGRVLGDSLVAMNVAVPGIFTQGGTGIGTAAAINQDGTVNSPTNPAVQGDVIQLFCTGQGFVPGAPADGYPSTAVNTKATPAVLMGTAFVPDGAVKYSGLAPGLVGVWQINVEIPKTVITTPNNPTDVVLLQNSVFSGSPATGREVQIYVKQRP